MEDLAPLPRLSLALPLALALLHQRVPPAKGITVSIARIVPGSVITGPQVLLAIRQRFILATLMDNATQLTAARHAIPTSFQRVPPPPSRRLIGFALTTVSTLCFTPPLQSP